MATSKYALRFLSCAASITVRRQRTLLARFLSQQAPLALRQPSANAPPCKKVDNRRWHSGPSTSSKVYKFKDVQQLVESPSGNRVLIDVREPAEYDAGFIPTAINIPVKTQPDAIFMDPEDFEDKFGFQKPSPQHELVFYCKAGVRSSAAAQLARQHGYESVGEYRGSWIDWVENGGETSKP